MENIMVTVLSVGGSIVAPQTLTIREWLKGDAGRKIIMVVGGGAPARSYQDAYRKICEQQGATASDNEADWIGITATYLNAQLLKACFADLCPNSVVYNPTEPSIFAGQVLIAAGWKPGFSTDYDAVLLAEKFSANCVVNLSNIENPSIKFRGTSLSKWLGRNGHLEKICPLTLLPVQRLERWA